MLHFIMPIYKTKSYIFFREALMFNKVVPNKFLLLDIDRLKFGLVMDLKEHILEYDSLHYKRCR